MSDLLLQPRFVPKPCEARAETMPVLGSVANFLSIISSDTFLRDSSRLLKKDLAPLLADHSVPLPSSLPFASAFNSDSNLRPH